MNVSDANVVSGWVGELKDLLDNQHSEMMIWVNETSIDIIRVTGAC